MVRETLLLFPTPDLITSFTCRGTPLTRIDALLGCTSLIAAVLLTVAGATNAYFERGASSSTMASAIVRLPRLFG